MELPLFKELQSPIYASVDSLVNNVANRPNQQQTKTFLCIGNFRWAETNMDSGK